MGYFFETAAGDFPFFLSPPVAAALLVAAESLPLGGDSAKNSPLGCFLYAPHPQNRTTISFQLLLLGQALDRLVHASLTPHDAYTSCLSTL